MAGDSLTRRKPLATILAEAEGGEGARLGRSLSAFDLVAMGVGATIGAGIFVITREGRR